MSRYMRWNNTEHRAFQHWARQWRKDEKDWLDPGPILNRAFKIPCGGSIRVFGPAQSGMTAIALHLAKIFQEHGGEVVYLDFSQSLFPHRVRDLDLTKFAVPKVISRAEILDVAQQVGESPTMIIVDTVRNIREDWQTSNPALYLRQELRSRCPNSTLVFCELSGKDNWIGEGWDVVLSLTDHVDKYQYHERWGHLVNINGPEGTTQVFISHISGRIHQPYIQARLEVEGGKTLSADFGEEPNTVRGFWRYVYRTAMAENSNESETDQN